jgi:phospholipid/cholesterol/gamma-HCH transport system substrate-binding protein
MSRLYAFLRRTAVALVAGTVLAGCGFSAYDLPLPGGAGPGDDSYQVTVRFADVLDLVPRSAVKVDDVTVGEVEEIWLDGFTANVRLRLDRSVRLPDNATAQIRQTSLLGEKFVSVAAPGGGQRSYGRLANGDVIPLARTGRSVEVEEVLSALSLLLNGGGVAQLKTINVELTKAMDGRETDINQLLRRLDTFVGELDAHKREITRAIDSLDRLSASLAKQRKTIGTTVDELPAALTILADQRKDLTRMLVELSKLGDVGTRVIEGTRADLLANLEALAPILTELAKRCSSPIRSPTRPPTPCRVTTPTCRSPSTPISRGSCRARPRRRCRRSRSLPTTTRHRCRPTSPPCCRFRRSAAPVPRARTSPT